MSFPDFIDISSDEETETTEVKDVKPILLSHVIQENTNYELAASQADLEEYYVKQSIREQISCNIINGASYDPYLTHRGTNPTDGLCPASSSHSAPVALSRQFWKSGEYEAGQTLAPVSQNHKNRLRIHPKFLHSNATSHKWAFGAIAELLDNAVDEVQNGATFVIVDKLTNPRNGEAALLVHDDGGGMDPESLRRCMSFGFSDKQSDATIGQYGNGFKTSTMRLGADVIVFSRCMNKTVLTQSVGLLSYTFLRQTGCDDIVVPVVDYEFDPLTGVFARLLRNNEKQFSTNLSTLLRWSPFASESKLLEQFNDIGHHGTKVIVFNLWYNDDGDMELDFESDPKDILINKTKKKMGKSIIADKLTRKNVASRLQYSLRAYSSILYLRVPETFKIILRGEVVMQHHVVSDLIYLECVVYRPQVEGYPEVLTTIGFLEGAPNVDVHGFNVYHKNRLILPFWRVANNSYGKGRGVVGVLEANFIKPTHDKQDFEKSSIYQKLENRLKEMTYEYWDLHCHLIGYKSKKVVPGTSSIAAPAHQMPPPLRTSMGTRQAKVVNHGVSVSETSQAQVVSDPRVPTDMIQRQLTMYNSQDQTSLSQKRKLESHISSIKSLKKKAVKSVAEPDGNHKTQLENSAERKQRREMKTMMLENTKLRKQCLELEEREKELLLKEEKLTREIRSFQLLYKKLSAELNSLGEVKVEKL